MSEESLFKQTIKTYKNKIVEYLTHSVIFAVLIFFVLWACIYLEDSLFSVMLLIVAGFPLIIGYKTSVFVTTFNDKGPTSPKVILTGFKRYVRGQQSYSSSILKPLFLTLIAFIISFMFFNVIFSFYILKTNPELINQSNIIDMERVTNIINANPKYILISNITYYASAFISLIALYFSKLQQNNIFYSMFLTLIVNKKDANDIIVSDYNKKRYKYFFNNLIFVLLLIIPLAVVMLLYFLKFNSDAFIYTRVISLLVALFLFLSIPILPLLEINQVLVFDSIFQKNKEKAGKAFVAEMERVHKQILEMKKLEENRKNKMLETKKFDDNEKTKNVENLSIEEKNTSPNDENKDQENKN